MKKVLHFTISLFLCFMFLFVFVPRATATYSADITYDYVANSGGNYDFIFTVFNTSTTPDTGKLDFFQITFDADPTQDLYSNIAWVVDKGWDSVAYDPGPGFGGVPGAVLADDSVLYGGAGGIAQGGSLAGFKVNFDYAGTLAPTAQLFSWYANFGTSATDNGGIDMGGYWVLGEADGTTRYVPTGQTPIPEPGTILLLTVGLGGIFCINRRRFRLFH